MSRMTRLFPPFVDHRVAAVFDHHRLAATPAGELVQLLMDLLRAERVMLEEEIIVSFFCMLWICLSSSRNLGFSCTVNSETDL